jgi:hypothetical protein
VKKSNNSKQAEIFSLKKHLHDLETAETLERTEKFKNLALKVVKGMDYNDMCDFRNQINILIHRKYASDATDDE